VVLPEHAVRLVDGLREVLERGRLEAELGHVELQVRLVEQPKHDLLAEDRRQAGDAEVHLPAAGKLHLDAAVLGQAALGDVQLGHHLDARRDGVLQPQWRLHDLVQHAVDAEADAEHLLVRLHVDVAGALADGVGEERVHQLDDRRLLGGLLQLLEVDLVLGADDLHALAHLREHRVVLGVRVVVVALDRRLQNRGRRGRHLHVVAGEELHLVDGHEVRRVGHRDGERGAHEARRDDVVLADERGRHDAEDFLRDVQGQRVDDRQAVLALEVREELLLRHVAEADEVVGEGAALLALRLERVGELLRAEFAAPLQQVSEA